MFIEKGPVKQGSVQDRDFFSRMPAGWTLTQPPGKWAWDRPPKYSSPDEAVSFIIDRLEEDNVREQFLRLMFAGISIQEIAKALVIGGFSQGYFSPDIAEIIKAPLTFYLLGMAAEYEIPVKVFATPDGLPARDYGMDENTLFRIMKERNPDFARHIMQQLNSEEELPEPAMAEGFIGVSEEMLGSPEVGEEEEEYEE